MATILGAGLEVDLGTGSVIHVVMPGAVTSVNGMDGDVVLNNAALPPTYDRKADEIAAVAESYYNNRYNGTTPRFVYNWYNTYRKEAFRLGNIDCSAFVGLVLRGIYYADSPYAKAYAVSGAKLGDWVGVNRQGVYSVGTPIDRDSSGGITKDDWDRQLDPVFDPDIVTCNKDMSWAINPADYWCLGNYRVPTNPDDPESEEEDTDSGTTEIPAQGRPLSAANLAQLLLTMGYAVPLTGGFSAIKKGDFLFWASKYEDGSYKRPNRFLRISHVAVCVDVDEHGDHWYVDSMSEDYAPDNTIRRECLETGIPKAEYLVLAIRLRQGRAWERLRIIYNPQDAAMAVGEKQRFTCIAEGDIMHYQWQYCDDSYKEDTTKWTWVNSTLPRMASVSVTAQADMGYVDSNTGNRIRLYHCVCTDTHGRSLTSRNAVLTISPAQTEEV